MSTFGAVCKDRLHTAWTWAKRKLGLNHPGWPSEPRDETHATYRRQYETLLPTLKNLPRGVHHDKAFERRNAFLYLAEILDGLHNYGDDPILPPGVRRMVIRENQTRLAAFGEVEQPSWGARIMASLIPFFPYILIGGLLLSVTGWGTSWWNARMADRYEAERDSARAERDAFEASRDAYAQALGEERAARARDVAAVLEDTARTVESLQRQQARERARAHRERSRREDLATGSVDFNERLRELAQPADAGLSTPAAPAAGGDPPGGVPTAPRTAADAERSR